MKAFLGFVLLSGFGWLLDLCTFSMLVALLHVDAPIANFLSSYVGVTFVWFASLKAVFRRSDSRDGRFLFTYWAFQFVSILGYSQLLHFTDIAIRHQGIATLEGGRAAIAAKVVITPLSLLTNFLFMRVLTRFMRPERLSTHV